MEQEKQKRPARRRPAKSQAEIDKFWREFNEGVAATKADPKAWAEYQAERKLFDNTVGDGLGPEV